MKGRKPSEWLLQKRGEALDCLTANGWRATDARRVLGPYQRSNDGRAGRMAEMYHSGQTLAEIGAEFNLTRERVRQILQKQGVSSSAGGKSARARSRSLLSDEARVIAFNRRANRVYGCDYETAVKLNLGLNFSDSRSRAHRWRQQRVSAYKRGIEWNLTFVEWCFVWEESGKWLQHGRTGAEYCMSRNGDSGPYAVGNVKICTNFENISEGHQFSPMSERMQRNWRLLEATQRQAQVLEMSLGGKTNQEIADELGLTPGYITNTLCLARRKARVVASQRSAAAQATA